MYSKVQTQNANLKLVQKDVQKRIFTDFNGVFFKLAKFVIFFSNFKTIGHEFSVLGRYLGYPVVQDTKYPAPKNYDQWRQKNTWLQSRVHECSWRLVQNGLRFWPVRYVLFLSIRRGRKKPSCSNSFPPRAANGLIYGFEPKPPDCLRHSARRRCFLRHLLVCFCLRFWTEQTTIRYDTRCYFNLRSKADMSPQLNLPHGTNN